MVKLARQYFSFTPSWQLAIYILLGHGVAVGALCTIPLPKFALTTLLIVLSCSAIYYLLRDASLKLASAWIAMRLEEDCIVLFNRRGEEWVGKIQRSSVTTPHVVILNIALSHHRWQQNVVLMADSLDKESFRKLRVALKWGVAHTI